MTLDKVSQTFVAGIKTACISRQGLVDIITTKAKSYKSTSLSEKTLRAPMVVFDVNGHAISMAHSSSEFYSALKEADIIHADGQSVVNFSGWFGNKKIISERTPTTDTIHDIPTMYDEPLSHYLLGGQQQVVAKCAEVLSQQYPNFIVSGIRNGYFSAEEEQDVINSINDAAPDVLWVGLGKPKEQLFVIKNKSKLKVPVIITCGGCYNYITGDYARAPKWMQNVGMEWLHRALTEPKKFLWRYITTNPHAIYCVLKYRRHTY
jgi:N-acetylglucosaminyldiphosphoundecaprenol N-acetyl-beta-D-mannosaminyltransferase